MNALTHRTLIMHLKDQLPVVEGVQWDIRIDQLPTYYQDIRFSILAEFTVSGPAKEVEVVEQAMNKIHQITSAGQIRLELDT